MRTRLHRSICLLVAMLATGAIAPARADGVIYKCRDASGAIEFTDIRRGPHCKPLELPGMISAPPRQTAPASRPAAAAPAPAPAPAPPDFPRIQGAEQRARDADRRAILDEELKSEAAKLAELRREYNNGEPERRGDERNYAKYQDRVAQLKDSISRSEKNIDAIKREIATIR